MQMQDFTRTCLGAFHTVALVSRITAALVITGTRYVDALGVGMTPVHHVARYWDTSVCAIMIHCTASGDDSWLSRLRDRKI